MSNVPAAIQAVFEKRRGELRRRIDTLDTAVTAVLASALEESLRSRAERDAHKLAGSLGMFGMPRGSELAREVEQALAAPDGPQLAEGPRLAELVLALRSEFDHGPTGSGAEAPVAGTPADGRSLLVVSPDRQLAEQLVDEALKRELRPRSAASCADARRLVATRPPDAVVLDVSFSESEPAGLQLLAELTGSDPPVPVFVLTGSEALVDRVEVARRGGRGFIQRSRPAEQVIEAVSETIERRDRARPKVLAVDDDPAVTEALAALLAPVGLEVTTVTDPRRFWERLEEIDPDLVVFDMDMPGLGGIDLCRAVRADARFGQLPVLFLTARADAASVQRIFEAGADDFVSKPIVGPELVTRIRNRLDRVQIFRDLAERDGLTGVASRRKSTAALESLVALADRFGQPLSIALIDLDDFKGVNDRLGHAAGDAVLQRMGAVLSAAFRGEDVVGRWGGEEFVVGTYGMGRQDGIRRVVAVLESFRAEQFSGRDGRTARVSFSAGVAEFPRDGRDLDELYRAADAALYRAKAEGRNRVLPAGPAGGGSARPAVVAGQDGRPAGGG